jgi:hypothetical protein
MHHPRSRLSEPSRERAWIRLASDDPIERPALEAHGLLAEQVDLPLIA